MLWKSFPRDQDSAVGQSNALSVHVQWLLNVHAFNNVFMEESSSVEITLSDKIKLTGTSYYKYSKASWSAEDREVSSTAGVSASPEAPLQHRAGESLSHLPDILLSSSCK